MYLLLAIAIVAGPSLALIIWWWLKSKEISTLDHTVMAANPGDMEQMVETAGE